MLNEVHLSRIFNHSLVDESPKYKYLWLNGPHISLVNITLYLDQKIY